MTKPPREIDLNADLGESFGVWRLGDDDAMLDVVTSANVACGFHAGDAATLARTCRAAAERGVRIGAQVSYRDLAGFGRRFIDATPEDLRADVIYQIGALQALAHAAGSTVSYVKPHGALYNTIVNNHDQARAVAEAVHAVDPGASRARAVRLGVLRRRRSSWGCAQCPRRSPTARIALTDNWFRGASATPCCTTSPRSPTGSRRWSPRAGSPPSTGRRSQSPSNPFACTVIRRGRCRSRNAVRDRLVADGVGLKAFV